MSDEKEGIIWIPARKCKRCGGILTSEKAIKDGYGHTCKIKALQEHNEKKADENQVSFFDVKGGDE